MWVNTSGLCWNSRPVVFLNDLVNTQGEYSIDSLVQTTLHELCPPSASSSVVVLQAMIYDGQSVSGTVLLRSLLALLRRWSVFLMNSVVDRSRILSLSDEILTNILIGLVWYGFSRPDWWEILKSVVGTAARGTFGIYSKVMCHMLELFCSEIEIAECNLRIGYAAHCLSQSNCFGTGWTGVFV